LRGGNYKDITIAVGDLGDRHRVRSQAAVCSFQKKPASGPEISSTSRASRSTNPATSTVPYAGAVKVAGLTARAVSDIIRERSRIAPSIRKWSSPSPTSAATRSACSARSIHRRVFRSIPGASKATCAIARAGGPK